MLVEAERLKYDDDKQWRPFNTHIRLHCPSHDDDSYNKIYGIRRMQLMLGTNTQPFHAMPKTAQMENNEAIACITAESKNVIIVHLTQVIWKTY